MFWYTKEETKVRWVNTLYSSFQVGNYVKQGGILSPVLFNIYMDKLNRTLINTAIGGPIGGQVLNHLCYADDICLISISLAGMQKLLNVCHSYSIEHSLLYNGNKSYPLCFKPTSIKFERPYFYLKVNAAYFNKKKIIMDENNALSEYNKIPLGHNRTNGAFTPKSVSKLRSALHIRYSESSHASFPALILLKPNNHYNHGFPNTFDYNHYV